MKKKCLIYPFLFTSCGGLQNTLGLDKNLDLTDNTPGSSETSINGENFTKTVIDTKKYIISEDSGLMNEYKLKFKSNVKDNYIEIQKTTTLEENMEEILTSNIVIDKKSLKIKEILLQGKFQNGFFLQNSSFKATKPSEEMIQIETNEETSGCTIKNEDGLLSIDIRKKIIFENNEYLKVCTLSFDKDTIIKKGYCYIANKNNILERFTSHFNCKNKDKNISCQEEITDKDSKKIYEANALFQIVQIKNIDKIYENFTENFLLPQLIEMQESIISKTNNITKLLNHYYIKTSFDFQHFLNFAQWKTTLRPLEHQIIFPKNHESNLKHIKRTWFYEDSFLIKSIETQVQESDFSTPPEKIKEKFEYNGKKLTKYSFYNQNYEEKNVTYF